MKATGFVSSYIPAALRRSVYDRANGCCEYCFTPDFAAFASHKVDHITAEKHGGLTQEANLALSCSLCNKHKGINLASIDPQTGEITPLYHPRRFKSGSWHPNESNRKP